MRAADEDLASEFDYESELERKRQKRRPDKPWEAGESSSKWARTAPSKGLFEEEKTKEEGRISNLLRLDAYSRHKQIFNDYYLYYPGATKQLSRDGSKDKTDIDVIRENQKFLWDPSVEPATWEQKLAKRYYDKLFKEYCICDLSRYKENKVAMRWRTQPEVVEGKGQFICGSRKCPNKASLSSWEVNFSYVEDGGKKNALVKLRLCPDCSYKLNYRNKKKLALKKPKKDRKAKVPKPDSSPDVDVPAKQDSDILNKAEESKEPNSVTLPPDPDVWKNPVELEEEKSRDEEFEDFLDDLLL